MTQQIFLQHGMIHNIENQKGEILKMKILIMHVFTFGISTGGSRKIAYIRFYKSWFSLLWSPIQFLISWMIYNQCEFQKLNHIISYITIHLKLQFLKSFLILQHSWIIFKCLLNSQHYLRKSLNQCI